MIEKNLQFKSTYAQNMSNPSLVVANLVAFGLFPIPKKGLKHFSYFLKWHGLIRFESNLLTQIMITKNPTEKEKKNKRNDNKIKEN